MRSNIRTTHRRVLLAGSSLFALAFVSGAADAADLLTPGSLIISTTTYSDTGAVAGLNPGTSLLPGANAGQTVPVVSGGNYVTVWNNAKNDGSFGVTSAINLMSVNGKTGTVNSTLAVPTNQVVTSFSSKSELSLNITNYSGTPNGYNLTFMGYAGAGVGALDVSNSDTPGIPDATNPVTSFFGSNYAFARTIVNVGAGNTISYTPTNAYGGNNGRSAVLGPNGKYYTVGNSNNGASTTPNAITTSTGLEVFNATNSSNAQGTPQNPTQINPNFNSVTGDKFGKDNNYRGLTYYNGNLYFTKGSGSNGIDTVYTVSAARRRPADPGQRRHLHDQRSARLPGIGLDLAIGQEQSPDRQERPGLHALRPVLRQPDHALCGRRRLGRRHRCVAACRPRKVEPRERQLGSRLHLAERADRHDLYADRRNHPLVDRDHRRTA